MGSRRAHLEKAGVSGVLVIGMLVALGFGSWSSLGVSVAPLSADAARMRNAEQLTALNISDATLKRRQFLKRSTTISFTAGTGGTVARWTVSLAEHPSWIIFEPEGPDHIHAMISAERIRSDLLLHPVADLPGATSCRIIREAKDAQGVVRAQTDCIASEGYRYDVVSLAVLTKDALESGTANVSFPVEPVAPSILASGQSGAEIVTTLQLLATGRSNFKGSGEGRKANVRKALNEHVNNVIVPKGATFSFNSVLGDKVSVSRGWHMALTIFNGVDLKPAPGGGICQASTTLYRAALQAGFPILAHKSHSLYVVYYEKYGVGLDATVFPGQQDMTFVNDSSGPLLLQSYNRGDDAYVQIYGIDDHRAVTMTGPYFASTAPKDLRKDNGHAIARNEIAWQRTVVMPTGEQKQELFVARYQAIPRSLAGRSPATTLHVRGLPDIASVVTVAENR